MSHQIPKLVAPRCFGQGYDMKESPNLGDISVKFSFASSM